MKQDYLQNWTLMMGEVQKPFQEILELNVKTLQGLKYLTFQDMASLKQPGELLDKQAQLMMKNSHIILDYMTQSFQLLEDALVLLSNKQFKENTVQSIKKSGAARSNKQKIVSKTMMKSVKPSEHKQTATKNKIAATKHASINSKNKSQSMSTPIQKRAKPEHKTTEPTRKQEVSARKMALPESKKVMPARKTLSESKKDISIRNPVILNERQKDATVLSKAVSDKKEDRLKNRITKLERKMGMQEPKTDLLLDPMSIPDDLIGNPPDILDNIPEHHPSHYEHPLPEQEGRGKNPFKK